MAPQRRHWDGFWTLFKKAESEVKAAYGGESPSVMVVDVGALSDRMKKGQEMGQWLGQGLGEELGQGLGQGLGQEQHCDLPPSPPPQPSFPTPPSNSSSPPPPPPPMTTTATTTRPSTINLPIIWGVGDRTGMFLLVVRALVLLQRIPVTAKHTLPSPDQPSSAQGEGPGPVAQGQRPGPVAEGQGLEASMEEVCGDFRYSFYPCRTII